MSPPEGNKFWEARSSHGRNPLFPTPEALWDAACEYFQWVEDNPLWETKSYQYQGVPVQDRIPKLRPMTNSGLCLFLDISPQTLFNYKEKDDFMEIIERIKETIYNQKLAGATADLMNANIIARELGLRDGTDNTHRHQVSDLSEDEIDRRLAELEQATETSED